jgi:hypothetical protein
MAVGILSHSATSLYSTELISRGYFVSKKSFLVSIIIIIIIIIIYFDTQNYMHVGKFTIIPPVISDNNDRECLIGIPVRTRIGEKVSCQISTCCVAYTKYHTTVSTVRKLLFLQCSG